MQRSTLPGPTWERIDRRWSRLGCEGEAVEVRSAWAREIYLRAAPGATVTAESGPRQQARRLYEALAATLEDVGAAMSNVVSERIFFQDFARDWDAVRRARQEAYGPQHAAADDSLPIASSIGQRPSAANAALELQIYAVVPGPHGAARVWSEVGTAASGPQLKIVEIAGRRHLHVAGIVGVDDSSAPARDFAGQCDAMFRNAESILNRCGATFANVLRTWYYITDIDRTYEPFNVSRNAFFARQRLKTFPASTGIGAAIHPSGAPCVLDLHAVLNPEENTVEIMHAETLNEASQYGSSFSRGLKVSLPDKTLLFISGTASVDAAGATVHQGDVRRQVDRTLLNIRQLLAAQGAGMNSIVQATSYLKSASDLPRVQDQLLDALGESAPHTIVQADICRPNLLCETEALAVLKGRPKDSSTARPAQ